MKGLNLGGFFRKIAKTIIRIWPYMVFSLILVSAVIYVFINTANNQAGNSVQSSSTAASSGENGDTSLSMKTVPFSVDGPVTAYGLCPFEYGTVNLVSEKLDITMETDKYTLFNKDDLLHGTDAMLYDVQMEYTVETASKARFTLPFAAVSPNWLEKVETEIAVDGKKIEYTASTHPLISVSRQSINSPGVLSDDLSCNFVMDSYKRYTAAETIGLDTVFTVYDLSQVNSAESFELTRSSNAVTLLFTEEDCVLSDITGNTASLGESAAKSFSLTSETSMSGKWIAVAKESGQSTVIVSGLDIKSTEMTLNEILSEKFGLSEVFIKEYLKELKWRLTVDSPESGITVAGKHLKYDDYVYNYYNLLNLYDFYIETPGTHTVTIKTKLVGSEQYGTNCDVRWADSPSSMWSKTGERKLIFNNPDGTVKYDIPDIVLDCCIPKAQE